MSDLNVVSLTGRLVADPELRYTSSGTAVSNFTLAINRPGKESSADFVRIVVWEKQAENVVNYLAKGRKVAIKGHIQTGKYESQDGNTVYTTNVVAEMVYFIDSAKQTASTVQPGTSASPGKQPHSRAYDDDPFADNAQSVEISDDDLPF